MSGNLDAFERGYREESFNHKVHEVSSPYKKGFLKVSDQHEIYYALYGNPDGTDVVCVHGGPGFGNNDSVSQAFDLEKWHVIMFDQRGAMQSKPFGLLEDNTPQNSVSDMEMLREHLGIEKWVVFGGSWGSTLSMLYGQTHPEKCLAFILRGVWLCREADWLHLFHGMGKVFPERYQEVLDVLSDEEKKDPFDAYCKRLFDNDPAIHMEAAKVFMRFDLTAATHLPNKELIEKMVQNDQAMLNVARTFCHYAQNRFFMRDDQLLDDMHKIGHIPAILVHGRWDAICLPENAFSTHQKWDNSQLWMVVDGGHSAMDRGIAPALAEATDHIATLVTKNP